MRTMLRCARIVGVRSVHSPICKSHPRTSTGYKPDVRVRTAGGAGYQEASLDAISAPPWRRKSVQSEVFPFANSGSFAWTSASRKDPQSRATWPASISVWPFAPTQSTAPPANATSARRWKIAVRRRMLCVRLNFIRSEVLVTLTCLSASTIDDLREQELSEISTEACAISPG
jgi:hypothetical protein